MTSLYNKRVQRFPVDLVTDFLEMKRAASPFFQFCSAIHLRHLRARQTYRRLISDSRGFNNAKLSGELNELYTPDLLLAKEYICCL